MTPNVNAFGSIYERRFYGIFNGGVEIQSMKYIVKSTSMSYESPKNPIFLKNMV